MKYMYAIAIAMSCLVPTIAQSMETSSFLKKFTAAMKKDKLVGVGLDDTDPWVALAIIKSRQKVEDFVLDSKTQFDSAWGRVWENFEHNIKHILEDNRPYEARESESIETMLGLLNALITERITSEFGKNSSLAKRLSHKEIAPCSRRSSDSFVQFCKGLELCKEIANYRNQTSSAQADDLQRQNVQAGALVEIAAGEKLPDAVRRLRDQFTQVEQERDKLQAAIDENDAEERLSYGFLTPGDGYMSEEE